MSEWRGILYAVFGKSLWINGTHATGTICGSHMVQFALGGSPTKLIISSESYGYTVNTAGVISSIHDTASASAWTSHVPAICDMDGYLFILTYVDAAIYHSENANATVWPPLNVISAEADGDRGIALAKHLNYLVAFGEDSIEFFYNAANATGSVLSRVDGAKLGFGCVNGNTVQDINGTLIWVNKTRQVMALDNMRPAIISTPAIDRLNQYVGTPSSMTAWYSMWFSLSGHTFYILTHVTNNYTIAYDLMEKAWFRITDSSGNYWPFVGATQIRLGGETSVFLQHRTNGNIYDMSVGTFTETGGNYTVKVRSNNLDFGDSAPKSLRMMQLMGDRSTSSVKVRYTDDDFTNWSPTRSVSMSLAKPRIYGLGDTTQRAFEIAYTGSDDFRLYEIDFQFSRLR
jgi:hypothetical protein